MIIKNNRFAAKFIIIIFGIGLVFPTTLFFVLNEVYTLTAFAYYILGLVCIVIFGFLSYLLFVCLDKKYYQINETKMVFYKKNIPIKEFEYEKMMNILYIKIWYIFLLEFEAGHLFFYYNDKPCDISMSYKQALKFQKISKLMIRRLN
ncbi:MAG: hypothetical protein K2P14_00645 [Anaeroplasmataceae bacterium]|nr:hypothetical protein [Anaeroplasmataceae bacterium]